MKIFAFFNCCGWILLPSVGCTSAVEVLQKRVNGTEAENTPGQKSQCDSDSLEMERRTVKNRQGVDSSCGTGKRYLNSC